MSESPTMDRNEREWENLGREEEPSTGVLSEIERHRVVAYLYGIGESLRVLRADRDFWLSLGPAFRVRYEEFQADLAAMRAAYRE